jgi:polysaccharide biosynthesis protein PslJ
VTTAVRRTRAAKAPESPSMLEQFFQRHPIDAVTALTAFLFLSYCIPSPLIVGALGGAGTPGNLIGVVFLIWWAAAKMASGLGVDRGRQPVRVALLCFSVPVLTSIVVMFMRTTIPKEVTGAERGLLYYAALIGIALLAADGITSLERVHVLMRRVVHFATFVAVVAIVQFLTGYNPAGRLRIPGLARNLVIENQARSRFLRVQSTTLHPIELGALMGIALPIALTYAFLTEGKWPKRIVWAEVLLIGAVLPMALSRTGAVVALVGMIAIAMDWSWKRRGRVFAAAIALLAVMRLLIPGLIGTMIALFTDITQDNSTVARLHRYQIAGHYFLQHPWFGRGLNTLYPVSQQIFDNAYLYLAVEEGVFGIVGMALFLFILLFTARGARLRSTDPMTRALSQALAGVVVAMGLAWATADLTTFTILIGTFFLIAGVIGAMWRLTGGQGTTASELPADQRREASSSPRLKAASS